MTLLVGSIFHMTRKIVSEMTYNVSMGTLNPTIPYYTIVNTQSGVGDSKRVASRDPYIIVHIDHVIRRMRTAFTDYFSHLLVIPSTQRHEIWWVG